MELPPYTIKLDNLDLNYFLNHSNERVLPLWDLNARSEYREFQMFVGRVEGESSENDIMNETYKCILCNLDVPIIFKKEHDSSMKHKICIEIAKIVLERLNNKIVSEDENPVNSKEINEIKSAYFCDSCVLIVNLTEKGQHENSEHHFKSVLFDRYLKDLQMIYKDRNYLDNIDLTYLFRSGRKNQGSDKSLFTEPDMGKDGKSIDDDDETGNDEEISGSDEEISGSEEEISDDDEGTQDEDEETDEGDEISANVDEINYDDERADINYAKSLENDDEKSGNDDGIEENHGDFILFDDDDDEDLTEVSSKSISLKLSDGANLKSPLVDEEEEIFRSKYIELLTESTGKKTHKFTLIGIHTVHIETIDKCLLEVSFDSFNGLFAIPDSKYIQCRICRIIIAESKMEHCLNWVHVERVRMPLENIHCYRQVETAYKHCALCNDNFIDVEYHQKGKAHMAALMKAVNITCRPVQRIVASSLKTTSSSTYSNGTTPSNKTPKKNNQKKIENNNYLKNKTNQITANSNNDTKMSLVKATTPKTKVGTSKSKVDTVKNNTPVVESKASVATAKSVTPNTKVEIAKSKADTKNKEPILETKVAPANTKGKQVQTNSKPETSAIESEIQNLFHHYELSDDKSVHCKVCITRVPFTNRNLTEHISGNSHKTAYAKLLNKNSIDEVNDKLYCNACDQNVETKMEFIHIRSDEHKSYIVLSDKVTNTKSSGDTNVLKANNSKNSESNNKVQIDPPHHLLEMIDDKNQFCKICQIMISINKSKEHMCSPTHITKYVSWLRENGLKRKKNGYRCKFCRELIRCNDITDHLISMWHSFKKSCGGKPVSLSK